MLLKYQKSYFTRSAMTSCKWLMKFCKNVENACKLCECRQKILAGVLSGSSSFVIHRCCKMYLSVSIFKALNLRGKASKGQNVNKRGNFGERVIAECNGNGRHLKVINILNSIH